MLQGRDGQIGAAAGRAAKDGGEMSLTLEHGGLRARILAQGATLQDLRHASVPWPLVVGAEDQQHYSGPLLYAGAVVGPVANRVAGAAALIGGQRHQFDANDGTNTLHSGKDGLHARRWEIVAAASAAVTLRARLSDGLGGFPGERVIHATYRLLAPATLELELSAVTDRPTLLNLTHHTYWNLDGSADIGEHRLRIAADHYLPVDAQLIPEGPPRSVEDTAFDFRKVVALSQAPPLDHNFCLANRRRPLAEVAELTGASGMRLRISTTEPGLQIYDGRHLALPEGQGLDGRGYGARAGLAIEAQGWPDAPNRPDFPKVTLVPGEIYRQITRFCLEPPGAP